MISAFIGLFFLTTVRDYRIALATNCLFTNLHTGRNCRLVKLC